jgi:hypothetical protein
MDADKMPEYHAPDAGNTPGPITLSPHQLTRWRQVGMLCEIPLPPERFGVWSSGYSRLIRVRLPGRPLL